MRYIYEWIYIIVSHQQGSYRSGLFRILCGYLPCAGVRVAAPFLSSILAAGGDVKGVVWVLMLLDPVSVSDCS